MAAVFVITYHMVAIICLVCALVFGIIAAAKGGLDHPKDSYKAFLLIGIAGTAVATLLQFLLQFVDRVRSVGATYILTLIFVIIGGAGYIGAASINGNGTYAEMGLVACVFGAQAILIYVIQWKFSA